MYEQKSLIKRLKQVGNQEKTPIACVGGGGNAFHATFI